MLTTMIWVVQIKVENMHAPSLVDRRSIPIPEEEERVENRQKQVRNKSETLFLQLLKAFAITSLNFTEQLVFSLEQIPIVRRDCHF